MKTRAIEFGGVCALRWCKSHNNTPGRGGVEILIDSSEDLARDGQGEMVCITCALRLVREIEKRAAECTEKRAKGLEYRGDRWRKKAARRAVGK